MFATLNGMGWTMMVLSIGAVSALVFWCFKQVLTGGKEPDLPGGLGA